MNVAMGLRIRPTSLVPLTAAVVLLGFSHGVVNAQTTLKFRTLASTSDENDAKAIKAQKDLFAKAKDDATLQAKLKKAMKDGVPPNLSEPEMATQDKKSGPDLVAAVIGAIPGSLADAMASSYLAGQIKTEGTKPRGSYEFVELSEYHLLRLGFGSKSAKNKALKEKLEKARDDFAVVDTGDALPRNLLLYSTKSDDKVKYYVLARDADAQVGGTELKDVRTGYNDASQPAVLIKLNEKGAQRFKSFSQQNVKHILIIQINSSLIPAGRISELIDNGEMEISSGLSLVQANEITGQIKRCMKKDMEDE